MKAYILAAGYATRLGELARGTPKPLLGVAGRPVLSHVMDTVSTLKDLSEVVVVTNSRFYAQFQEWAASRASDVPVRVLDDGSTGVENRRGAIGDLAFGVGMVPPQDEDWVVIAGDNLVGFDLASLQQAFRKRRCPLLALRRLDHGEAHGHYNSVALDDDGRVVGFSEKPSDAGSGVSAIALYFFTPGVTILLARYLDAGHDRDAPGHFISWLVDEIPVSGAFFEGDWFDVGRPDTLELARRTYRPKA